jgi:hypothetical protein
MNSTQLIGKLANPKLTLFAFQLCNNLAKGDQQTVDYADHLWHQCVALGNLLQTNPKLDSLPGHLANKKSQNSQPSDYLELYESDGNKILPFTTLSQPDKVPLEGAIYPVQLHDTYALDLTLLAADTLEINQLNNLNFQGCLLPHNIKASLGQTLVFFAKPVDFSGNHQELAVACIEALFQDVENQPKPYLIAEGKLLGSPIFEFDNAQENPSLNCHILLWLNTDENTSELEDKGDYYRPLLNLLCCRTKIIYTYYKAQRCNEEARKLYTKLEQKVEEFSKLKSEPKERLKQLEDWLIQLPQIGFNYARYLRDIELHLTTIETNADNYGYWHKQLVSHSLKERDNLDFIQDFLTGSCQMFQKQIKVNMSYLTAGRQLFQQMIETIRIIVELDGQKQQAEFEIAERQSDAELQNTIQSVGAGIGAGIGVAGIIASSYPLITQVPIAPFSTSLPPHPFVLSLLFSLLFGAGFGFGTWRLTGRIKPKDRDSRNQIIGRIPGG